MNVETFANECSLDALILIIAFKGWHMAANDYRNGDTWANALKRHKTDNRAHKPGENSPDLSIFRTEYVNRIRAKCGM